MIRLLARTVLAVLANAVGLLVASALLDGFDINGAGFITAVLVFTVATVVLGPLVVKIALTSAAFLVGGIALVTTLIGLIITDLFTDGLTINGLDTWILATLIIWLCTVLASVILPLFIFKEALGNRKDRKEHRSEPEA